MDDYRQQILDYLRDNAPASRRAITAAVGGPPKKVLLDLRYLVKMDAIALTGDGPCGEDEIYAMPWYEHKIKKGTLNDVPPPPTLAGLLGI